MYTHKILELVLETYEGMVLGSEDVNIEVLMKELFDEKPCNKMLKTKKIVKSDMDGIIDNSVNIDKTPRKCGNCGEIGHNTRTCSNPTIENEMVANKKARNKKALDNENNIIKSINNNEDVLSDNAWGDLELNRLNTKAIKITKAHGFNILHTKEWENLKDGTKELCARAKTDIQISDDMKKINISIKSGKGRFTSADCYETNAIFKSVYNDKFHGNLEIKSIIEEIVMLMKNLGKKKPIYKTRSVRSIKNEIKQNPDISDEDTEWVKKLYETEIKCNELWLKLKTNHIEYVKDILFECVSGKYKFGDNEGRAYWLFITENSHSVKCKHLFKLDKRSSELDAYLIEMAKSPNAIKVKTGGTGEPMWIRFL